MSLKDMLQRASEPTHSHGDNNIIQMPAAVTPDVPQLMEERRCVIGKREGFEREILELQEDEERITQRIREVMIAEGIFKRDEGITNE